MSHLLRDKKAAEELYLRVKQEVQEGLDYLLLRRVDDPYKDLVPRLLYEKLFNKQAPTFEV